MLFRGFFISLAFLAGLIAPAIAQDASNSPAGHFQLRLRGAAVLPDPSATIMISGANIGGTTKVTDSFIPEADLTYFFTDHIAVEAIAAVTKHSVSNSVAGPVASVWLLPPTVTAQYHFDPNGPIRPYVGAGINYTFFYDAHSALPNIGFKNNLGWAFQAGVDVPVGDGPYFLNFDVKKIFLNTTIRAAGGTVRASASLDPWLVGAGVGIRF
jgi:outer membrane protein